MCAVCVGVLCALVGGNLHKINTSVFIEDVCVCACVNASK